MFVASNTHRPIEKSGWICKGSPAYFLSGEQRFYFSYIKFLCPLCFNDIFARYTG